MPVSLDNPWRGVGLDPDGLMPVADASGVAALLRLCPANEETPLRDAPGLARLSGVAAVWVKDERQRMGLGSFKALGATHAIARLAAARAGHDPHALRHALAGQTFVAASAGNHGLSVAAGARLFGAAAVIFLSEAVPDAFAKRLESHGAQVVRAGADYEASMTAAAEAAETNGWTLLSDSSWPGYTELPLRVMEGYTQLAAEAVAQMDAPPTHVLLQAGVGGLAAAVAAHVRLAWGDAVTIVVVEPDAAPALIDSIRAGQLVTSEGPVSSMGRLDCKTPSMIALAGLSRDADRFVTITEAEARFGTDTLADHGFDTTPSGAAGFAALLAGLNLGPDARVLGIVSEGPEDG
ncbi:pyridoxal-phosphate dependent enzyme [Psychromarinibacter halotolerans]|uniref:Pyridoxal-phosphate dependent enzyme n=1 Tax=Psychromarinibacter halotolerans TaxID=1775175 RepID=A0ABV7GVI2_9RHOB|nr:pyridoxal-phosphate dependent enzyme [Psychromarinibacter halotolerans]MDF0596283.1 pyridoxal-phosphate dependent enzyme [Psychromarinibacter halotolerans]